MARKSIVDREAVLQLLKEGNTSQSIAGRFGVSRQAIDLYRKQFIATGKLPPAAHPSPTVTRDKPDSTYAYPPHRPEPPLADDKGSPYTAIPSSSPKSKLPVLSLDQLTEVIIQAFSALKRVRELEAELAAVKKNYAEAVRQIETVKEREQKRREQEQRWLYAQQPGILTFRDPDAKPPPERPVS